MPSTSLEPQSYYSQIIHFLVVVHSPKSEWLEEIQQIERLVGDKDQAQPGYYLVYLYHSNKGPSQVKE